MKKTLTTTRWQVLYEIFRQFGGPFFDAFGASHLGFKHSYLQAHIAVAMYNAQMAIDNADSQYNLHPEDFANHDNFQSIVTDDRLVIYWTSRSGKQYEIKADRDAVEVSIEFEHDSSLAESFESMFEDNDLLITQVGRRLSKFGLYLTKEEEQHVALGTTAVIVQEFTHDVNGKQINEDIDDQYFHIYIAVSEEDMGQNRVMTTYDKYTVRSAQEMSNIEFGALAYFIESKYKW